MPGKGGSKEINILLVGETGIGKSTWINSMRMYLSSENFKKAKNAEFDVNNMISTEFVHYNEDGEEVHVKIGQDDNENLEANESHTLKPKAHIFQWPGYTYRIIDTPGISNTENDKKNMQEIVNFISKLGHLHLIVLLLEPNKARLTPSFAFYFEKLIMHFHRSAASNIVFGFTKAAGCHYKLRDTAVPLKNLLNDLKETQNIDIPLDKTTTYIFDNESFRYFCVKHFNNKYNFSEEEKNSYKKSYEVSRKELIRLFIHAQYITPHDPKATQLMNYTQNVIVKLAGPLAKISTKIDKTLENCKEREAILKEYENKGDELIKKTPRGDIATGKMANVKKRKRELAEEIAKEKAFKEELIKERDIITKAATSLEAAIDGEIVAEKDIQNTVAELRKLKHYGGTITKALESSMKKEDTEAKEDVQTSKPVHPKQRKSWWSRVSKPFSRCFSRKH